MCVCVCVRVCDIVLIAVCGTLINCFNYITLSKSDSFVGGVVCCILLTLCIIILRARHDHNIIAPRGMIKVFLIELNYYSSS